MTNRIRTIVFLMAFWLKNKYNAWNKKNKTNGGEYVMFYSHNEAFKANCFFSGFSRKFDYICMEF